MRTARKKLGRKPSGEKRYNLHVQVNLELHRRVQKRADDLEITVRTACERGLRLFLEHSTEPRAAPKKAKLAS